MFYTACGAVDIKIATGPHDQTVNMPFLGHPLADEPLSN